MSAPMRVSQNGNTDCFTDTEDEPTLSFLVQDDGRLPTISDERFSRSDPLAVGESLPLMELQSGSVESPFATGEVSTGSISPGGGARSWVSTSLMPAQGFCAQAG